MDPAKLKVVELRAELAALGLDTKGNKPVLVERLRLAIAQRGQVVTDTTIADTSTEDVSILEPPEEESPRPRRTRRRQSTEPGAVASHRPSAMEVKAPSPVPETEPAVDSESNATPEIESAVEATEDIRRSPSPQISQEDDSTSAPEEVTSEEPPSQPEVEEPIDEITPQEEEKQSTVEQENVIVPPVEEKQSADESESMDTNEAPAADNEPVPVDENESNDGKSIPEEKEVPVGGDDEESSEAKADDDDKSKSEKDDDKYDNKKDRKKRDRHSRWSNSHQNDSAPPDNDVQVTGEYISIRDDDDDKNRGHVKRAQKRPREPSPRRKSPVRIPEPEIPSDKITISWYDSDLNLQIEPLGMNTATPLTDGGFALCWAGARASHGVKDNRVCYEVRIDSMPTPSENSPPGIRFGWSTLNSSLHLGDSKLSWGYEHSGRKVNDSEFSEYGTALKEKDVVGVYLDLTSSPCTISYTVNGESQGTAFEFEKDVLGEEALFPHILTRNCSYKVNFGDEKYTLITKTKETKREIETPVEEIKAEVEAVKVDEPEEKPTKMDEDEQYDPAKCTDDADDENDNEEKKDEPEADDVSKKSDDQKEDRMEVDNQKTQEVNQSETKTQTPTMKYEIEIELDGEIKETLEGYVFIGKLPLDTLILGPQRIPKEEQCDVIMMCGLPGSGKTYWSQKYVTEHPEKRFNVLGANNLVEKMKIDCKPFKSVYEGKWNILVSKITKCVGKLIEIAQNRRRNYILDQTNVYPVAQKRKMREFVDCKRTAVVIVPDEATYQERQRLREEKDGKDAPDSAVLEMKANFALPEKCAWMEEVMFCELNEEDAKKELEKYNKEGRNAGYGNNMGRSHSGGRSRSSSGAPSITKRSRFDDSPNDRGRRDGPDRNRYGGGPRNRNDFRRDDRRGGHWGGKHGGGGWGGRGGWGGPRNQPYGRDHQPYGRDQSYGRDQYNRDTRHRDGHMGGPHRGNSDRWNRGGHNRDSRGGGMDGRGRGDMIEHNRGERNDRGKGNWINQHNRGGGGPRNLPQTGRPNQPRQNGPQGGHGRSGGQGGENQGSWGHQSQGTSGYWNQQHQRGSGNWNQSGWLQGWNSDGQWGTWSGGQWNKFQGQQQGGGGQSQQQGQWGQWPQQWSGQQSYWAQWPVQQQKDALKAAPGGNQVAPEQAGQVAVGAAVPPNTQIWAQYQQYNTGYGANAGAGAGGAQEKK